MAELNNRQKDSFLLYFPLPPQTASQISAHLVLSLTNHQRRCWITHTQSQAVIYRYTYIYSPKSSFAYFVTYKCHRPAISFKKQHLRFNKNSVIWKKKKQNKTKMPQHFISNVQIYRRQNMWPAITTCHLATSKKKVEKQTYFYYIYSL